MSFFAEKYFDARYFGPNFFAAEVDSLGDLAFLVTDFKVVADPAALACTISWANPIRKGELDLLTIVRKKLGPSSGPTDGTTVYSGSPSADVFHFTDPNVEDQTAYYYTIFTRHPTKGWFWSITTQGLAIPVKTGFHAKLLWSWFPSTWVVADQRPETGEDQRVLTLGSDDETGYRYNEDEDQETPKGPLQRFLKILGAEWDLIRGWTEAIRRQRDIDQVAAAWLPAMAAIVGADVNENLSTEAQRESIKRTVRGYKLRGTINGMVAKIRDLSRYAAEVIEDWPHVLFSNFPERTSPAMTSAEGALRDLPGELLYYSADENEIFSWLTFAVFVEVGLTQGIAPAVVESLCATIPDFTPICRKGRLKFLIATQRDQLSSLSDSLGGGFAGGRDVLTPLSDSLHETVTLAPPSAWLYTNPDSSATLANNVTNNPERFTAPAV